MRLTGERAARRPARNASRPVPIAVMTPIPVIQMRRRSVTGRVPRPRVSASDSASALNVASVRPAIGRVKARVDEGREWRDPRPEVVVDRDVAALAGRVDVPGHVHPLRRPRDVDEAQAVGRGVVPRPGAPGDRDREPE